MTEVKNWVLANKKWVALGVAIGILVLDAVGLTSVSGIVKDAACKLFEIACPVLP